MRNRVVFLVLLVCLFSTSFFAQSRRRANTQRTPKSTKSPQTLPITRVVLYSNGVAYIERRGIVSGNAEVDLDFKQSQVDDVLKSMIVLDLGQGRIGAVSYNSSAPPSARMAEIPFSVNATTSNGGIASVLSQLQGAKVMVTSTKGSTTGAILTVEKRNTKTEKSIVPNHYLVIASESGDISSFNLADVRSVKLLDKDTKRDVKEFASASASSRRRDAKTITVTSEGSGQRELVVSYTTAAPIWKTTYRVVLDDEGKPFFQGWAIVDNVSDEDWKNVKLSLVSGSPVSFIQNLQKPYYRYRPVVPVPSGVQIAPQTHETGRISGQIQSSIFGTITDQTGAVIPGATVTISDTASGFSRSTTTSDIGAFVVNNLRDRAYTVRVEANGFKIAIARSVKRGSRIGLALEAGDVSAMVNVTSSAIESVVNTEDASIANNFTPNQIIGLPSNLRSTSDLLRLQSGAYTINGASGSENTGIIDGVEVSKAILSNSGGIQTAASGDEIGDLFEYKIDQPITVMRNRSALIPIVQTKMEGERVSIYNEALKRNRPLGGMLLKNTTPLTFETGSLTVIDRNAYAGEALMKRLKPKESRLISYALDLGVDIKVRNKLNRDPAKLVKVVKGVFQIHLFRTNEKVYEISNQTDRKKVVYIEYPIKSGWKLSDKTPEPDYRTQTYYRFRVELDPFENKDFSVAENQPLVESYRLATLTGNNLDLFLRRRYIDTKTRAELEKLIDIRSQIARIDSKLGGFKNEENSISKDQARLRENIEALSKTAEAKQLITRYVQKVDKQETRIEEITRQRRELGVEKQRLTTDLATAIRNFQFENRPTD